VLSKDVKPPPPSFYTSDKHFVTIHFILAHFTKSRLYSKSHVLPVMIHLAVYYVITKQIVFLTVAHVQKEFIFLTRPTPTQFTFGE
jgi:hypothetical protein